MADLAADFARDGFVVFDADPRVARWATRAHVAGCAAASDPEQRRQWLRHGQTWFVGVDALPNAPDGVVDGVALAGPWQDLIRHNAPWHRAQVSVTYPGYPQQDPTESDGAHRYRILRSAAHVDGLHLEGGRRILREPHAFILGIPLNESDASPLVIWRGSHLLMQQALARVTPKSDPRGADVTEAYIAARQQCFAECERIEVPLRPGQCVLLHRLTLHGMAPWQDGMNAPPEGRMIAYFRPECTDPADWLRG